MARKVFYENAVNFIDLKVGENMAQLICYCFNYTEEDIKQDVLANAGHSTILARINAEMKAGNCKCATKHPQRR